MLVLIAPGVNRGIIVITLCAHRSPKPAPSITDLHPSIAQVPGRLVEATASLLTPLGIGTIT